MKKSIIFASLALLCAGCSKDNFVPAETTDYSRIRVEATIGDTRATLTNFEAGDCFSLYAVEYEGENVAEVQTAGNYLNNESLTFDGSKWLSARPLYWSAAQCDFYGFYPYQPTMPMKDMLFEVATDQSTPRTADALGGYEASDLMWAKAEAVTPPQVVTDEQGQQSVVYSPVKFQFHHMMTRVVVDIVRGKDYEGELPKDIEVHIYNTATSAIVDWTIGSLKADPQGGRKTIKMRQLDADTFDAIVVPQFIQRSTQLIAITTEGYSYLYETSISLRPGKQHTFTVTLNTSPEQENIEIEIEGGVGEWN